MQTKVYVDKEGNLRGLADDVIDKLNNIGVKHVARVSDVEFSHSKQLWEARDQAGVIIASGPIRSEVIAKEREYFNRKIEQEFAG